MRSDRSAAQPARLLLDSHVDRGLKFQDQASSLVGKIDDRRTLVKMQALRAARPDRFACLRTTGLDVEDAESQHRYGFST